MFTPDLIPLLLSGGMILRDQDHSSSLSTKFKDLPLPINGQTDRIF